MHSIPRVKFDSDQYSHGRWRRALLWGGDEIPFDLRCSLESIRVGDMVLVICLCWCVGHHSERMTSGHVYAFVVAFFVSGVDWCTSAEVLDVAATMKENGMLALGYDHINLDDCVRIVISFTPPPAPVCLAHAHTHVAHTSGDSGRSGANGTMQPDKSWAILSDSQKECLRLFQNCMRWDSSLASVRCFSGFWSPCARSYPSPTAHSTQSLYPCLPRFHCCCPACVF